MRTITVTNRMNQATLSVTGFDVVRNQLRKKLSAAETDEEVTSKSMQIKVPYDSQTGGNISDCVIFECKILNGASVVPAVTSASSVTATIISDSAVGSHRIFYVSANGSFSVVNNK